MRSRDHEPWEIAAPGPSLTIRCERGTVEVRAHHEDRYTVHTPSGEHEIIGLDAAREEAHRLAGEL